MTQDISLTQFLSKQNNENHVAIDVRSPKEFHNATIPGSINIPLFTNEERAEVGTAYKQKGKEVAKKRGLEIFSKKLPYFIEAFEHLPEDKSIFCWRGGMRSQTAVTVLELMDIPAHRIQGGYRTYRQHVVNTLDTQPIHPELYVLNGFTGTGKTEILHRLADLGYPVIDLEGMAGHRGSIFGQIGQAPHNQKKFDSLLYTQLTAYQNEPYIFIEGESKRIGRVLLPDLFYDKKQQGKQFYIHLPIEKRIEIILAEYHPETHHEEILHAYKLIKKRIHQEVAKEIDGYLFEQAYEPVVRLLLEYYYDPRYQHSNRSNSSDEQINIHANHPEEAVQKIIASF